MSSKRYPGSVVWILALFACTGWIFGWLQSRAKSDETAASSRVSTRDRGRANSRNHERDGIDAGGIKDSTTLHLLRSLADIEAAAVPGEANQALVKACRSALLDSNIRRRERNYGILLELMRPEDASALHELFLELHAQGKTYPTYGAFATRWGEIDPVGALEYLNNEKFYWMPPRDFSAFARGWGVTDPKGAMKWIEDHPEQAPNLGGRLPVFEGWVREDPAAALQWLNSNASSLSPDEYIRASRVAFLEQVQGPNAGLQQAVSWITSLPKDPINAAAAHTAWNSTLWSMGELNYATAADVWPQVANQEWMGIREFKNFSETMGRTRTASQGTEGLLRALESTWPPEQISDRFAKWTSQDPEATSAWLANAPDTPVTQAAIAGMIRELQNSNPAAAAQWQEKLRRH